MKPRKKQRIETEENGDAALRRKTKVEKKKDNREEKEVSGEAEESSQEDEGLDGLVEDEDELPGTSSMIPFLRLLDDEMAIDETDSSEESDQDDFQDVKLKSTPIYQLHIDFLERKKQTKDPAAFATAMSAILSSSLKAHARAVPLLPSHIPLLAGPV